SSNHLSDSPPVELSSTPSSSPSSPPPLPPLPSSSSSVSHC
ncbi:unnamed protein product, partial [Rotaria sp. Silwood1]